jgi:hypothetical protein
MTESWKIAGGLLEYIDETHKYLFNGVILPSVTQILKIKFGNKYNGISKEVLQKASEKGTMVHQAIEDYEKRNIDNTEIKELRNYKFLKKRFEFECLENEIPIVLFLDDKPVCAGRIDLILKEKDQIGVADIKRTSSFDKEYVAYQTNLYRIGYQQCYGTEITFLRGIHLRDDVRKYISLPIDEDMSLMLVKKYLEERKNNNE